jgi:hypothetical protein
VVPATDGCFVLAKYDLDLTYEDPQGIFLLSDFLNFGEAKGTLPVLVKNFMY